MLKPNPYCEGTCRWGLWEEIIRISALMKETPGGFPHGAVVKNPPANAGDKGSSPGPETFHMLRNN